MTKKERKKLYHLIEQWTRCEIMARHAPLEWPEWGDYSADMVQKENEIRELMFGTGNLVLLGQRWGLPGCADKKKKKKKKQLHKNQ